jgi:hypothetical protein
MRLGNKLLRLGVAALALAAVVLTAREGGAGDKNPAATPSPRMGRGANPTPAG